MNSRPSNRRQRGRPPSNRSGGNRGNGGSRPETRVRGNAKQQLERYRTLAAEALTAGDRIRAESLFQHAEHYQRILNERSDNRPQDQNQKNQRHQNQSQNKQGQHRQSEKPQQQGSQKPSEKDGASTASPQAKSGKGAEERQTQEPTQTSKGNGSSGAPSAKADVKGDAPTGGIDGVAFLQAPPAGSATKSDEARIDTKPATDGAETKLEKDSADTKSDKDSAKKPPAKKRKAATKPAKKAEKSKADDEAATPSDG